MPFRTTIEIDYRREAEDQLNAIRSRIGQEVPLSNRYVRGQRAILYPSTVKPRRFNFPMAQRLPMYRSGIWWTTSDLGHGSLNSLIPG